MTDDEKEKLRAKWHDVITRGEEWYEKLQKEVEAAHPRGHFIAINVSTGDFVVAKNREEVLPQAEKTFPADAYYYVRGIVDVCPDVEFAGCPSYWEYKYARQV
jgi:hypothetical protein